jgi:2-dehydropantoate 2-reductase
MPALRRGLERIAQRQPAVISVWLARLLAEGLTAAFETAAEKRHAPQDRRPRHRRERKLHRREPRSTPAADVALIDQWPEHVEAMRANGLTIAMPDAEQHVKVRAHHLCDVCTFQEPFDVVLLAVKAYDTRWACETDQAASGGGRHADRHAERHGRGRRSATSVGPERTLGCVVELSSEMFTPARVQRNTPPRKTWIGLGALEGGPESRLAEMQALLAPVGQVEIKADILSAKWMKLVVNAMCLGPIAMVGMTLFDAIRLPGMRELIVAIGDEAMRAGQDQGYSVEPIFGLTEADLAGSNRPAEMLFDKLVADIGPGRGRNTVLQDFLKGRASEVGMINGLVVEESERRGRARRPPTPASWRSHGGSRPAH